MDLNCDWFHKAMIEFNLEENNTKSVYNWEPQDCYNWALNEASRKGINLEIPDLDNFYNFSGIQLARFTPEDFTLRLSKKFGTMYFESLQELLRSEGNEPQQEFLPKNETQFEDYAYLSGSSTLEGYGQVPSIPVYMGTPEQAGYSHLLDLEQEQEEFLNLQPLHTNFHFDDTLEIDTDSILSVNTPPLPPSSPTSSSSSLDIPFSITSPVKDEDGYNCYIPKDDPQWPDTSTYTPSGASYQATTPAHPLTHHQELSRTRTPRPSRRVASAAPVEAVPMGRGPLDPLTTPSRKRSRGPRSWEYIVRMLADNTYNPSLLSWVNREEYSFKFNKPGDVAKMWGLRSKKEKLSYDNFARGLRYHYKTEALKPVAERQLVYKLGQKAIDFYESLIRY